jgi:hypothetical protein
MTFLRSNEAPAARFAGHTFEPRGDGSYWAVSADGFATGVVYAEEADGYVRDNAVPPDGLAGGCRPQEG